MTLDDFKELAAFLTGCPMYISAVITANADVVEIRICDEKRENYFLLLIQLELSDEQKKRKLEDLGYKQLQIGAVGL